MDDEEPFFRKNFQRRVSFLASHERRAKVRRGGRTLDRRWAMEEKRAVGEYNMEGESESEARNKERG